MHNNSGECLLDFPILKLKVSSESLQGILEQISLIKSIKAYLYRWEKDNVHFNNRILTCLSIGTDSIYHHSKENVRTFSFKD